jgi:inorganic pyrophosphatase
MRIQDTVKFELDKASGFLSLDRPHKFSSIIPSLYGFIPRTYSHTKRCPPPSLLQLPHVLLFH